MVVAPFKRLPDRPRISAAVMVDDDNLVFEGVKGVNVLDRDLPARR